MQSPTRHCFPSVHELLSLQPHCSTLGLHGGAPPVSPVLDEPPAPAPPTPPPPPRWGARGGAPGVAGVRDAPPARAPPPPPPLLPPPRVPWGVGGRPP